jgi:hypothetical protein
MLMFPSAVIVKLLFAVSPVGWTAPLIKISPFSDAPEVVVIVTLLDASALLSVIKLITELEGVPSGAKLGLPVLDESVAELIVMFEGSSSNDPTTPDSEVKSTDPLKLRMLLPETSANPPDSIPVAESSPEKEVTPSAHTIILPPSPLTSESAARVPVTSTVVAFVRFRFPPW